MNSRQRIINALNFKPVDRVPVDLGATACSSAHVSVISKLRLALGLDKPGTRTKVADPYQMLGEIASDLLEALGIDVVNLPGRLNFFGFANEDWKPWRTFDGTDVLVPGKFNTVPEANGDILMYPEGDKSARPSGRMPKGGYYFDTIVRQDPIDEAKLNIADNLEEFTILGDEDLGFWQKQADEFYKTGCAIAMEPPGTAFGDVALVPAPFMKNPKGIRDIEEWYISTVARKSYVKELFEKQTEIAIENLKLIYQAVGNKVQIMMLDGADLAAQNTLFCSPQAFRELYLPYNKKINDWVHANTEWKSMKHCCGACEPLIDGFIEAGFDALNPIQCSAKGMNAQGLVDKYGGKIVFWGGGVDTQKTLPFGTPDEVRQEVKERLRIFGQKNGFVFNPIHNIQCNTPIENVIAMFEALGRKSFTN